jgi:hypothetical protein
MNRVLSNFLTIASCALAVCLALCFAILAWTEPSQTPPNGNVAAPINTSANPQTKAGDLGIKIGSSIAYWISQIGNSLVFKTGDDETTAQPTVIVGQDGHVGIGTTAPNEKLDVAGNAKAWKLCLANQCCSSWQECAEKYGNNGLTKPVKPIKMSANSCQSGYYLVGTGKEYSGGPTVNFCCPLNSCFYSFEQTTFGSYALMDYCYPNGYFLSEIFQVTSPTCGWSETRIPMMVCRNGQWRLLSGENSCAILSMPCDQGGCVQAPVGVRVCEGTCCETSDYLGHCETKNCASDAECTAFVPSEANYQGKCVDGLCCKSYECNVDGRCAYNIIKNNSVVANCKNGLMYAAAGQSCDQYPCDPASGTLCDNGLCVKGVCVPGAVKTGCTRCNADGSAWVDDSTACGAGQVCHSGNCCADECNTKGQAECVNKSLRTCVADANGCLYWSTKGCRFCINNTCY